MKKFVCLLLMLVLSFSLFSACVNNMNSEVMSNIEESPHINISSSCNTSEYSISQNNNNSVSIIYSALFRSDIHTSKYWGVYYPNNSWIGSLIIDNTQQLLRGNTDSNTDIIAFTDNMFYSNMHTNILAKDYYTHNSTGYENLTDDHIIMSFAGNFNMTTTTKVEYIDYSKESFEIKDYWLPSFSNELISYNYNSPILISESWSFTYDNKFYEIVTATNVVYDETYQEIINETEYEEYINSLPFIPTDDMLAYKITLMFIDGQVDTQHSFIKDNNFIQKIPVNSVIPSYEISYTNNGYQIYVYDGFENIVSLPVISYYAYDEMDNFRMWTSYMFIDINDDGNAELIEWFDLGHSSNPKLIYAYTLYENFDYPKLLCPRYFNN